MASHDEKQYKIASIQDAVERLGANLVYPPGKRPRNILTKKRKRKVALVLSGGGASGAFEAGVIEETMKALQDYNEAHKKDPLKIDAVIGTSTGSLNTSGILMQYLLKHNLTSLPDWLETAPNHTVNAKLWGHLAENKSPARFAVDKPWVVRLMFAFKNWVQKTFIAGLVLLFATILLTGPLLADKIIPVLKPGTGTIWGSLAGGALFLSGFALMFWLITLLKQKFIGVAHPLSCALSYLFVNSLLLGMLKNGIPHIFHVEYHYNIFSVVFLALMSIVLLVLVLWFINGRAIFANNRLKRLVASLFDPASNPASLVKATTDKKADLYAKTISEKLTSLYLNNYIKKKLPAFIFTATDILAQKQGLFFLGKPRDSAALAKKGWMPLGFENNPKAGSVKSWELIRGIASSTAIPFIYPAEVFEFKYLNERHKHIFVDGGVLDFAAYHTAIDLGCTHILAIETDSMKHDNMEKKAATNNVNFLENVYLTTYTGSDVEAREEAARVADTNNRVVFDGLSDKDLILMLRITPAYHERMINSQEFDGRFVDGKQVHNLMDWMEYGMTVNPEAGKLPPVIWYRAADGSWEENKHVTGPVIWDASFQPVPKD